ncbi:MAG: DJ-1/PfpI family protein [bacterium]|nr:DJ-1/PfpI family protein [bacterium]
MGKRALMIIASRNFRDEEYIEPRRILEREGVEITVASSSLAVSRGMLGTTVKPDKLIQDVVVSDYDAIIFIGGQGASEYWNNLTAHKICKDAIASGKILAAICIAPTTLANAGVLSKKRVTAFPSEASKLRAKGANYTGKGVEVSGDIITADGPSSAVKFGDEIVKALI